MPTSKDEKLEVPQAITWGPVTIDFLYERGGAVWFDVKTKACTVQMYVTKSGRMRQYDAQRNEIFRGEANGGKEKGKQKTLIQEEAEFG